MSSENHLNSFLVLWLRPRLHENIADARVYYMWGIGYSVVFTWQLCGLQTIYFPKIHSVKISNQSCFLSLNHFGGF